MVSWIASTCRPAIAAPVSLLQPSTIFAAVTFGLAKNRPACSSPPRLTPSRPTGHVRGQAPTYRLARDHPFEDRTPPLSRRRSPNDPSDHSISAPVLRLPGQTESYPRRVGRGISQIDTVPNITCAHALAPSQGQAPKRKALGEARIVRQEIQPLALHAAAGAARHAPHFEFQDDTEPAAR